MEQYEYDVVVVGGGAAGLSGAVALLRSRRPVLVVDAGRPRNAPAAGIHNMLTRAATGARSGKGVRSQQRGSATGSR